MLSEEEYKIKRRARQRIDLPTEASSEQRELLDSYFRGWAQREYEREYGSKELITGWLYGGMIDLYEGRRLIGGRSYSVLNIAIEESTGLEVYFGKTDEIFQVDGGWLDRTRTEMLKQSREMIWVSNSGLSKEHYRYDCGQLGRMVLEGSLKGIDGEEEIRGLVCAGMGVPREYREQENTVGVSNTGVEKEQLMYLLKSPIMLIQHVTRVGYKNIERYIRTGEYSLKGQESVLMGIFGGSSLESYRGYLKRWCKLERELLRVQMTYHGEDIDWQGIREYMMVVPGVSIKDSQGVDMQVVFGMGDLDIMGAVDRVVVGGITLDEEMLEGIESVMEYMQRVDVRERIKVYNERVKEIQQEEETKTAQREQELEEYVRYIEEQDTGKLWSSEMVEGIVGWYRERGSVTPKQETILKRHYRELMLEELKSQGTGEKLEVTYKLSECPEVLSMIKGLQESEETSVNILEMMGRILKSREVTSQELEMLERVEGMQSIGMEGVTYSRGTYMIKERPDLEKRLERLYRGSVDEETKHRVERILRYGVVSDEMVEEMESRF